MVTLGLFVRLEAKPGKEDEVAAFLEQGLELAIRGDDGALVALRLGPTMPRPDAFATKPDAGSPHRANRKALMANAPHPLAPLPVIERADVRRQV